jgi:hypothetical protein
MNTAASGGRMPSTPRGSSASSSSSVPGGVSGNHVDDPSTRPLEEWSVKDLRAELRALNVPHDDCLEKKDFIDRLNAARQQQSAAAANERKARDGERAKDKIMAEVADWSRRLDLFGMINDLLSLSSSSPDYISPASTFAAVSKVYKRALLVVHPVSGSFKTDIHCYIIFDIC